MLARETRGRQIFRRRRTPHGDRDAGPGLPFKLAIRFHDLLAEGCRVHRPVDDFAGLGGGGRKLLDLALVETVEKPMQLVGDAGLRQRIAVSVGRDGKAVGDSHPFGGERRIEFAERGGLAADKTRRPAIRFRGKT